MYPGDVHELRKWAVNRGDRPAPEPFQAWVRKLLTRDRALGKIGYWLGVITPDSPDSEDGEWCRGYPHAHCISVGWEKRSMTAVTYLAVPEEGGQFGLGGLDPNDPFEFIDVEEGLTVVCDGATWHGSRPVTAGTRIALISSGPPM